MSTDLSDRKFTDSAQNGAFSWLFEGFRTRMRDTAKAVRMEAAWQTWPTIHKISKALHEALEKPADREAMRQSDVNDLVDRLGQLYSDPATIGDINDPATRERLAFDLGIISECEEPGAQFPLDEVLERYEAIKGTIPTVAATLPSHEIS